MKSDLVKTGMKIGAMVVGLGLLVFGMKPLIQSVALIFLAFNAYYLLQDIQPSRK